MSRYLKPRDHGYLMEAAACTKVLEDLRRIEAKYARTVEKEGAVRQAEFEKVMQYHSERELQDDFGWGFITEAQYDRYRLLFQQGQAAMEQLPPTKSELALRLVRRIVRDVQFRDTTPERTLSMWDQVVEGEDRYIRPYRLSADYTVNSIHIYEPCVMRTVAIPLLRAIAEDSPYYRKARDLEARLMRFEPISASLVPENSMLRVSLPRVGVFPVFPAGSAKVFHQKHKK